MQSSFLRVLSIDPGYDRLGIAILDRSGKKEALLFSDCIFSDRGSVFEERLFAIISAVEKCIAEYKPEALALETLFFTNNQKTAMHVAEVRGALLYLAMKNRMRIFEYTPMQIKNSVAGDGRASKAQMMKMVPLLLDTSGHAIEKDDECDAIAVGLTCFASER